VFEQEVKLNGLMIGMMSQSLANVDDAELAKPAFPGWNPPAWILGHLAVTNDFALRNLGEPPVTSSEWRKRFRPGAKPEEDKSPYPTKAELLSTLQTGRERIIAGIAKVDPEKLKQPHGVDLLQGSPLKTVGDVLSHLLTTHYAFHMGQLSAWRRGNLGQPPLI
jgi:DinB superfamily